MILVSWWSNLCEIRPPRSQNHEKQVDPLQEFYKSPLYPAIASRIGSIYLAVCIKEIEVNDVNEIWKKRLQVLTQYQNFLGDHETVWAPWGYFQGIPTPTRGAPPRVPRWVHCLYMYLFMYVYTWHDACMHAYMHALHLSVAVHGPNISYHRLQHCTQTMVAIFATDDEAPIYKRGRFGEPCANH